MLPRAWFANNSWMKESGGIFVDDDNMYVAFAIAPHSRPVIVAASIGFNINIKERYTLSFIGLPSVWYCTTASAASASDSHVSDP